MDTGKELAFDLFDQGMKPSAPELKALGTQNKSLYTYFQDWKKVRNVNTTTTIDEGGGSGGTTIDEEGGSRATTKRPGPNTARAGTPTAPISVGKITITPENWGMTQYGASQQ